MDHPDHVGKYQIEQFLGGGMSNVYRATDTVLGRRVALKILTAVGAADEESKARFLMEARVASNITHENIISVYDFGEDRGLPFIVMEFLEGESLRAAIRNGHLGDFPRRMRIALQIARAVDFIHTKKIIHRDIKPENINIDSTGKIKLMDFGIAKAAGVNLTRSGFTLGTPYYMAPEQVLGQTLGSQADVYAFGALLFELLSGAKAISGDSVERIFENVLYQPVNMEPLRQMRLPLPVIDLIERCMSKIPGQRPASLALVCDDIDRILNPIYDPVAPPQPDPYVPPKAPGFIERLPATLKTQTGLIFLAGAVVAGVVTLIYVILALAHVV